MVTALASQTPPEDRPISPARQWLGPIVLFAAVSAFQFRRLLFGGKTLLDLDFPNIHIPFRTFTAAVIGSGRLPLWVPGLQFGLPYLANGDTAVLYPLQLPFLMMDPVRAVAPLLWMQTVLTMLTMFAFLRSSMRVSVPAACAGALVFGLNGFFMVHLGLLGLVYAQPWVPLLLMGIERGARSSPRWALAGAAGLALSLLSGHPQQLFFSAPLILMFLVWIALGDRSRRGLVRLVRSVAISLGVGAGLAAIQVLPQAELVANSQREQLSYQDAIFGSIEGSRFLTILLPDFWHRYTGEAAGWVGVTGLLLAIAGVVYLIRSRRIAECVLWLAVVVSSLVLCVGGSTPVYKLALAVWPGLESFRFPLRFLYPAVIGVAVLAAFGFEGVRSMFEERSVRRSYLALGAAAAVLLIGALLLGSRWERRAYLPAATAFALGAWVIGAAGRRWWGRSGVELTLLAGLAFELIIISSFLSWNFPAPVEAYKAGALRTYLEEHRGGRLASVPNNIDGFNASGMLDAGIGNDALLSGTPSVDAFGGQWPPRILIPLESRYVDRLRRDDPAAVQNRALFDLLGIGYVVAGDKQPNLSAAPYLQPLASENGVTLLGAREPARRARSYCGASFDQDNGSIQDRVLGGGFDPSVLWIEGKGGGGPGGPCGKVSAVAEQINSVALDASLPSAGWVFLSDTWYPGWVGRVDGEPVKVERAMGFFRAVRVPAGSHKVVFEYRPQPFRWGRAITIGTFVLVIVALTMPLWRRKRAER